MDNKIDFEIDSIQGISLTKKSGVRYIHLSQNTKFESIKSLLALLRFHKISFSVYDELYPSPSDPGAYFSYSQEKNVVSNSWSMTFGNHGWSGGIYVIDENVIACQIEDLVKKGLIQDLEIENVVFFSYFGVESSEGNVEMNERIVELHDCLSL